MPRRTNKPLRGITSSGKRLKRLYGRVLRKRAIPYKLVRRLAREE